MKALMSDMVSLFKDWTLPYCLATFFAMFGSCLSAANWGSVGIIEPTSTDKRICSCWLDCKCVDCKCPAATLWQAPEPVSKSQLAPKQTPTLAPKEPPVKTKTNERGLVSVMVPGVWEERTVCRNGVCTRELVRVR